MKHIFITAIIAMLTICSCDSGDYEYRGRNPGKSPSTYTVIYDVDISEFLEPLPDQTVVKQDVFIKEYNDKNECINIQEAHNVKNGDNKKFTAHDMAEKVTVYYEVKTSYKDLEKTMGLWLQQVFYLEKGKNISITISGDTRVGSAEPIN